MSGTSTITGVRAHAKLVLVLAMMLPGAGHVALGHIRRALGFLFFMLVLGWLTTRFAPPAVSYVGRHAAGFFVYALSITDAYRLAAVAALRAQTAHAAVQTS